MAELKLTRFTGLVPRLHERNLPETSATKILDVDLSNGTLKPFRTNKKVSDKTGNYIFVDNCCYITSDNCKASVDIIEDECSIVVATGLGPHPLQNLKSKACNNEWVRLGFPETTTPTAQAIDFKPLPHQTGAHFDMAREVREYFYTLVTCLGEGTACQESIPSEVSNLVECHNGDSVVVSNILTTAPDGYKIDS
ncbi:MAG: hypothetical protein HXN28_07890, partial [Prevotella histicola]|uniref:hypothetical protein n=1 Tax=Prevotella histicola TaxID=470565 RepID=UPI001CB41108